MTKINNPFVGAWKLISWENEGADGKVTFPYGKDQIRHFEFKDGKLILSSKGSQLIWEKAIDHA
jgi:hypothetical protein